MIPNYPNYMIQFIYLFKNGGFFLRQKYSIGYVDTNFLCVCWYYNQTQVWWWIVWCTLYFREAVMYNHRCRDINKISNRLVQFDRSNYLTDLSIFLCTFFAVLLCAVKKMGGLQS